MRRVRIIALFLLFLTASCANLDTTKSPEQRSSDEELPANELQALESNEPATEEAEIIEEVIQKKIMIVVGNEFGNTYFDMKEALTERGYQVDTVYVGRKELLSSCPNHDVIEITGDIAIAEMTETLITEYEGVFIPSGKHHRTLPYSKEVERLLMQAKEGELFISSVCAGNLVLTSMDSLIDGYDIAAASYTREAIKDAGGNPVYKDTVVDGPFLTGDKGGGKNGGGHTEAPIDELVDLIDAYVANR